MDGEKANKRCLAPKGWGEDRLMLTLGLAYKYFYAQHVEHLRCSTFGRPVRLDSERLTVGGGPTRKLRSTAQKKVCCIGRGRGVPSSPPLGLAVKKIVSK